MAFCAHCEVFLSEIEYETLCKRTTYFHKAETFDDNAKMTVQGSKYTCSASKMVDKVVTDEENRVKLRVTCHPGIAVRPYKAAQLIRQIAQTDILPDRVVEIAQDLLLLFRILDYFQIDIWEALFKRFLSVESFAGRNTFLGILLSEFDSTHNVVVAALHRIRTELQIPEEKHINLTDIPATLDYFRNTYRARKQNDIHTHYVCGRCEKVFMSRPDLRDYRLDNAKRLHCCGTIICNKCTTAMQGHYLCPYCGTYFTYDGSFDYQIDSLEVILKRNNIRKTHGIALDAKLPAHPGTLQQCCAPLFVP